MATAAYLFNDNTFEVNNGHLVLQLRTNNGHYEVEEFIEFIHRAENSQQIVDSIRMLTIIGRELRPGQDYTHPAVAALSEPFDVGLLQSILKTLVNIQTLAMRDLWISGGRLPFKPQQFRVFGLTLDNIYCSWNGSSVDFTLVLSLFVHIEMLQLFYLPSQVHDYATDKEREAFDDFAKATTGFMSSVTRLGIVTPGQQLSTYLGPIFPIFGGITSLDVNCRTYDDINSLGVLLWGIGARLTWFALNLSTLQLKNAEDPDCDVAPEIMQIVDLLKEPFNTLINVQCLTLRIGSVSVDYFDRRTVGAFRLMHIFDGMPINILRHLTIDFDSYSHCYTSGEIVELEDETLPNSWNPAYGDPILVCWDTVWRICRHFTDLGSIELLWRNLTMNQWKLEDREHVAWCMDEFSHLLKGVSPSAGCRDLRCIRG
ncbi:hypothetical protein BDY19DRAFT_998537 [Irpex rosettiformis]|uniref:Uncharacterized protein n=1 Tax=Irpex rosettiformis TaxID=378272 RepID=A0ACB8TN63_9APHY|nr:hypothetical protein BDY19DRAFT_998537 [Irpex rosettiformis]